MAPSITSYNRRTSSDDNQSSWNGARFFRTRRRVTFLLVAVVFASIVYSQNPLGEKYSLDPITRVPELHVDPPLTVTITRTAPPTIETVAVEPPVQPVVFSLVIYSESSAKEGAVLLKVRYLAFISTWRPLVI